MNYTSNSNSNTESFAISNNDSTIVVIGSGAGGASVAHELVVRGFPVLLLEAGQPIPVDSFVQDDVAAFRQLSWPEPRIATGNWRAATVAPESPSWTVQAVGGATLHWNGLAFRMQEHEFRPRSVYGNVEGASLIDWPIALADLAPFYDRAEDKLGVTGTHGIEPHDANNNYKVLWNGARAVGYRNMSNTRLAINNMPRDDRAGCIHLGFCNQGCKSGAKWTSATSEIPKALATGRLDLRTGAMAVRIEHDGRGKANAVIYRDAAGKMQRQKARLVCVAANAIETARLLLMSDSAMFPRGLANGSDQVGRNYTRHLAGAAFATFPMPVNMHRGITTSGVVYDEARHDPSRGFAGGYLIEACGLAPFTVSSLLDPSDWGAPNAAFMEQYDHMAGVLINGEDMPRADNRITLDAERKDSLGLPVPRVHVDEHPTADAMRAHWTKQTDALFRAVGATDVRHAVPALAAHNMGTARMSARPEDGVVDRFGRAHEVPNLFISDGSVFPSSSSENPTLTIVALALRQADYIASALKRGEL